MLALCVTSNALKQKVTSMSIFLYKPNVRRNTFSWVAAGKALKQSYFRIPRSDIYLDGISWPCCFFVFAQLTRKGKHLIQYFFIRCGRAKNKTKKKLPQISSSQSITQNPIVQSDCRIYWSAICLEEIMKFLFVFAYRKMIRRDK